MPKFNPLNKGNLRNAPCPCGSGKKTKKCHGGDAILWDKESIAENSAIINTRMRLAEEGEKPAITLPSKNGDRVKLVPVNS